MIALAAAGSAALVGLIVIILNLSTIGYIFDLSVGAGLIQVLVLLLAAGLIGGGVLIYLKHRLGPIIAGSCAAAIALFGLIGLFVAFSAAGLVVLLLIAAPAVLSFLPQTMNYVRSGQSGGPGPHGGFGQQHGGFGRPF